MNYIIGSTPPRYITVIAVLLLLFSSRDASYITGANIKVDGGYCAMGPDSISGEELIALDREKSEQ